MTAPPGRWKTRAERRKFREIARAFGRRGNPAGIPEFMARDVAVIAVDAWARAESLRDERLMEDGRVTPAARERQRATTEYLRCLKTLGLHRAAGAPEAEAAEAPDEFL